MYRNENRRTLLSKKCERRVYKTMTDSERQNNERLRCTNGKELTLLDELMSIEIKRMNQSGISENERKENSAGNFIAYKIFFCQAMEENDRNCVMLKSGG